MLVFSGLSYINKKVDKYFNRFDHLVCYIPGAACVLAVLFCLTDCNEGNFR